MRALNVVTYHDYIINNYKVIPRLKQIGTYYYNVYFCKQKNKNYRFT